MNFPILSSLILLPTIGALFIFFVRSSNSQYQSSKYVALFITLANFFLSLYLWIVFDKSIVDFQFVEEREWISGFVNYKVGVDGISILFILLTTFITPICVITVNATIKNRLKDFLIAILILETFMIGVFSIYWITGTTDVIKLYELGIDAKYQNLLWLAFFSSFAVKTPMWPVHTWLPDAHVEAPTAGSVLLAAILLKMAGYGFIRFSLGLFPDASLYFVPLVYTLSLIAIIYTSLVALMQEDMKKLIAYSSVAHMGFVTLGIFTMTQQGIEGSIFQMISHGLVSAALFLCVGVVYDRLHTRLINRYGGLVSIMPKYAIVFMVFTLGALGLPGTSGFIGEFLVLMGAFKKNILVATIASLGVILGAAYMLWLYKRIIFGKLINEDVKKMVDLKRFEIVTLWLLVLPIIFFGFYPEPLINSIEVSVANMIDMNDLDKINKLALGD